MKIAQRFSAGITAKEIMKPAKRGTEHGADPNSVARFAGLIIILRSYPALKGWAIFKRPLRGLKSDQMIMLCTLAQHQHLPLDKVRV